MTSVIDNLDGTFTFNFNATIVTDPTDTTAFDIVTTIDTFPGQSITDSGPTFVTMDFSPVLGIPVGWDVLFNPGMVFSGGLALHVPESGSL